MPLDWGRLVARQLARVPHAVDVENTAGETSRGPLDHGEVDAQDERGLSKLMRRITLTIPTADLPTSGVDTTLTVTEADGTTTDYTVRDRRRLEDGLASELVLVPS